MRDITTRHPHYLDFQEAWRDMRDAIAGEDDVKRAGTRYLPMKSGFAVLTDTEKTTAYANYQIRAEFPEIVAPTMTGQIGLICSQPPTVALPTRLEGLKERATPDGLTLEELYGRIVGELLAAGRYGLFPTFDAAGEPVITTYVAETIINWDTTDLALSYVVLDESRQVRNPSTNAWDLREAYLELEMVDGTFQTVQWQGTSQTAEPATKTGRRQRQRQETPRFVPSETKVPLMATTAPRVLDFMPFVIMGTRDRAIEPDDVPLWGLAKIAFRMYRMDADYQTSLHLTSEPTPWVSGYDNPAQAVADGEAPTTIGAAQLWVLKPNASAGFLEFSGAGLAAQRTALDAAKESASAFGARMFDETNRAPESGESRKQRYGHTTSQLKTIAKVAASGLERAIRNHGRWIGLGDAEIENITVTPNLDWVTDQMSPQELDSLVKSWQAGAVSYETLFERMKAGKLVASERTIEEETKAILDDPLRDTMEPEIDPNDPEAGGMPPRREPATPAS